MAKPNLNQPLSFLELVMRADAATLKAAYEARTKVDVLLAEREEAYRRIAELEQQVDTIVGEPGAFCFPEPPMPIAGFKPLAKPAPQKPANPQDTATSENKSGESSQETGPSDPEPVTHPVKKGK